MDGRGHLGGAMRTVTAKSWVEGPRWAKLSRMLRQAAFDLNLDISIDQDKGWIREVVYYSVTGPVDKIREFNSTIMEAVRNYNA